MRRKRNMHDTADQRLCTDCDRWYVRNDTNFRRMKADRYGYDPKCRSCRRFDDELYKHNRRSPSMPEFENGPDGKTAIKNSCGHTYRYKIQKPTAVKWLEGQPCPRCRSDKKNPQPQPKPKLDTPPAPPKVEPEPETPKAPEPKVDEAWVAAALKLMPKGLFHSVVVDITLALRAGLEVWLQGPPGTSKSTIGRQVAEALSLPFHSTACHPLMTESKLFGFVDANGNEHRTPLWEAFENGGVFLLDEVDNGNPSLLAGLNSLLSNGHAVFGAGTVVERHPDFRVIATANTAGLGPEQGFIGRMGVDLATRDRFVTFQVPIDPALEEALAHIIIGSKTEDELAADFTEQARQALRQRSLNRETADATAVVATVRRVRDDVQSRFRGTVVTPRTTIHAAMMVSAGFTLREALVAKLVGLTQADVDGVLAGAIR